MGIASSLAAIELTVDHRARGMAHGVDAQHFMRSARTRLGDVLRDLAIVRSTMPAGDPNITRIEAVIEALR